MNSYEFIQWFVGVVAAAQFDRAYGHRRFGEDFPMPKLPKTLNGMGASNLAAQIYNVAYEGWEKELEK